MKTKTKKSGFTLVELLVVIAIIGIISTIAVVNLRRSRIQAYAAAAMDDLFKIRFNVDLCHSENGTFNTPVAGQDICSLGADYGQWPTLENYTYIGFVHETNTDDQMLNVITGLIQSPIIDSDSAGLSWWWMTVQPTGGYNYRGDLYCYNNVGSVNGFAALERGLTCQWQFAL